MLHIYHETNDAITSHSACSESYHRITLLRRWTFGSTVPNRTIAQMMLWKILVDFLIIEGSNWPSTFTRHRTTGNPSTSIISFTFPFSLRSSPWYFFWSVCIHLLITMRWACTIITLLEMIQKIQDTIKFHYLYGRLSLHKRIFSNKTKFSRGAWFYPRDKLFVQRTKMRRKVWNTCTV